MQSATPNQGAQSQIVPQTPLAPSVSPHVSLQGGNLNMAAQPHYKPFISEKEVINAITNQENEITNTIRLFWDVIPRNFKIYKEYGDRLMNNGERMRLSLSNPTQDCKDVFTLLFQLGQFFEIIGRLFSQNFNTVQLEMTEPLNEAIVILREHKDKNLTENALKILPKAQQLHVLGQKHKLDYERMTKEAQESVQKMKNSKLDPNLQYNLSELAQLEEKASKAVREMEEKKQRHKATLDLLQQRNTQLISSLESLTNDHQTLVDYSTGIAKQFLEKCVTTELGHYENLNLITPEKAQVIKNFVIKQDLFSDIKAAEESSFKIDLQIAKQKLLDLPDGSTTHQAVAPFSQYSTDASEYYSKLAEKWNRQFQTMMLFLNELVSSEKSVIKAYRELNVTDRRKHENQFGPFQGPIYEFLRTFEQKERNHQNFYKLLETSIGKIEQIYKSYRTEEKNFVTNIQKIAKDVVNQNEKIGKQSIYQEKQLLKISQMLSSNFQGQANEKMGNFRQLMIEYQGLQEGLKDNQTNFKNFMLYSLDAGFELIKAYKGQQMQALKALAQAFQGLTSFAQILIEQQQRVQLDFTKFVDIIDTQNLKNQFKVQLINKHKVDFYDSQMQEGSEEQDEDDEANEQSLERFETQNHDTRTIDQANPNAIGHEDNNLLFQLADDANNNSADNPKDSDEPQVAPFSESQDITLNTEKNKRSFEEEKVRRRDSIIEKDSNPIDIKLVHMAGHPNNRTTMGLKTQSLGVSLKEKKTENLISPFKKQLQMLSLHQYDNVDEETQKDFDKIKTNMGQMFAHNHDEFGETQNAEGSMKTPNTKFLKEKFKGLTDGEKCIQTFACAMSLKILLQGRLYVTNKRICFHSYFNDKTIFGKETKFMIPFTDVKRIEKKINVMVFPNSISIFTKENREIFITSFVYRDQAFDLMQHQLDVACGRVPEDQPRSASLDQEPEAPPSQQNLNQMERGKENKNEYSQGHGEGQPLIEEDNGDEQIAEEEEKLPDEIFDNAALRVDEPFKQVEKERLEKVKKLHPNIEGFPAFGYEEVVNCSLKHIFIVFMNYNIKWPQLENLSLINWLNKYPLTNIDPQVDKADGLTDVPAYFAKTEEPAPSPEQFKSWPMTSMFKERVTHLVEKPKFMQPKQNSCEQVIDHFFISPRMIIRKARYNLEDVPFADSFNFDYQLTFEQLEGSPFRTKIRSEYRVNIIKPIRFLQGTVVKETEASLKETYGQGSYKQELLQKILQLKEPLRVMWNQRKAATRIPRQQQSTRASPIVQREEEKKQNRENQNENIRQALQVSLPLVPSPQLVAPSQPIEDKRIDKILESMEVIKQRSQILMLALAGLGFLNLILIGIIIMK